MSNGFDDGRLARVAAMTDRYVARGQIPGAQVQVAHEGRVAHRDTVGFADIDEGIELCDDAIYRIYSMTKPVTSVALMQLYERGLVLLEDPVGAYIPEFEDMQVWTGGSAAAPKTRPAMAPVTVGQLLTHTSGLTYGFFAAHPVDELYRLLRAAPGNAGTVEPVYKSGGGGLFSTVDDYQRFCDMLLGGGSLDGERIIGRKTVEYMTSNHLPGGATLNDLGQSLLSEAVMEGMGFGLGFSVVVDPAAHGAVTSRGEFAWGGLASTAFFVDPLERITAVFMTQFMPSSFHPIRRRLRATVYQALK